MSDDEAARPDVFEIDLSGLFNQDPGWYAGGFAFIGFMAACGFHVWWLAALLLITSFVLAGRFSR